MRVSSLCAYAIAVLVFGAGLPAHAVDTDGDGVDDSIDCRPNDATTWSAPTEATQLILAGGANTNFHWNAPATPGGTALLYDVISSRSAADFSAATCVISNTASTAPATTDPTVPGTVIFYLVRSKTACGSDLGTKSPAIARTGASCSTANGGSCTIGASCSGGWCCGGSCSDLTTDQINCGACGTYCDPHEGTNACVSGVCTPVCGAGFADCDGNPNNGCETQIGGVTSCGSCFNICPGFQKPNDNVTCAGGMLCTFTCQGENYDANNDPNDGCEVVDSPTDNHTQGNSTNQGSKTCNDSDTFSFNGKMINDGRTHELPAVAGFDTTTGSAPDWSRFQATGGAFCTDDVSVTLQVTGSTTPNCYKLSVITDSFTFTCTTSSPSGSCTVSHGSGAYHDSTIIYIEVQKTCTVGAPYQSLSYTVSGHF